MESQGNVAPGIISSLGNPGAINSVEEDISAPCPPLAVYHCSYGLVSRILKYENRVSLYQNTPSQAFTSDLQC